MTSSSKGSSSATSGPDELSPATPGPDEPRPATSSPAASPATGAGRRASSTETELLRRLGIEVAATEPESAIRAACLRAAQKLHRGGYATIGLLPASANVGVVWVGVNLAVSLAELSGSTVAYVDANLRWPALARALSKEPDKDAAKEPDVELAADGTEPGTQSPYSTRWLSGDVAILVPRQRATSAAGLGALTQVLGSSRELFARSLVDLTGWKRLGEHLSAFAILDGVVVVAQAGLTTEDELLRLRHEIPSDRHLGVLLLGVDEVP